MSPSKTSSSKKATWFPASLFCRPTDRPLQETGCTADPIRAKAIWLRDGTKPRPRNRPISASIPTGPGAGLSTGGSSTTALLLICKASLGLHRKRSSPGTARNGRATCQTADGRPGTKHAFIMKPDGIRSTSSDQAAPTARSPNTTSPWNARWTSIRSPTRCTTPPHSSSRERRILSVIRATRSSAPPTV